MLEPLLPVLLMLSLGAALRKSGFLSSDWFEGLNRLAFWVGLPCMLFIEIASATVSGDDAFRLAAVMILAIPAVLIPAVILGVCFRMPTPTRRAFYQSVFRGNLAYVGLPVIFQALPDDGATRATALLALAPMIPIYNIVSVLILLQPGTGHPLRRIRRVIGELARNPLIIACLLGMLALFLRVTIPPALHRTFTGIGRIGLPAALLALGASLTWLRLRGQAVKAVMAAVIKVAVMPLSGVVIARSLGMEGPLLLVCVIYLACPPAVAGYVMADQMGADRDLSAAVIVIGTLLAFPALAVALMLAG